MARIHERTRGAEVSILRRPQAPDRLAPGPQNKIASYHYDWRGAARALRGNPRKVAIAAVMLLATLVALNAIGYQRGWVQVADHTLYQQQRAKAIDTRRNTDIAFVGDSSCGNGIDAEEFEALSGQTTVNLALNGAYGSGGAYNMVRKVLDHHSPQLIVVMLSIDTMRRKDAFPGYYFSAEPTQSKTMSFIDVAKLYVSLKTAKSVLEQLMTHGFADAPDDIDAGAETQSEEHRLRRSSESYVERNPLQPGTVAPEQLRYVGRIAELCRSHGVNCVYAHGPVHAGYCRTAVDYLAELNQGIRVAGLDVVLGTPICMNENEVGNAIDHVSPEFKAAYTRRYFDLLRAEIGDRLDRASTKDECCAYSSK